VRHAHDLGFVDFGIRRLAISERLPDRRQWRDPALGWFVDFGISGPTIPLRTFPAPSSMA
jgi:hypothetical protein